MMSETEKEKAFASVKISLIGSFTLDLLLKRLEHEIGTMNVRPEFYLGSFGQYQQEILDERSGHWNFAPDVTMLMLDGHDLFRDVYEHPLDYSIEKANERVKHELESVETLVRNINERLPACTVLLNNIIAPPTSGLGLLECNSSHSLKEVVQTYNRGIEQLARDNTRFYIVDCESLVARLGYDNWRDERMWYLAGMPLSSNAMSELAKYYASYLKALQGNTKKCLVLDLDNTLWGGIIGEDGMNGIVLGQVGIGKAYYDFQNEIINLYKRGIVLAVSSKNNYDDAIEVIEKHPYMLLRKEYFSVMKIDWRDKATHLREIAEELNLGLQSFVFLDDSPFERNLIASELPEVMVPELPEDPSFYRGSLLALDSFVMVQLTEEDRKRNKLYRAQAMRTSLRHSSGSLEEFFESLQMHAVIRNPDAFAIPRLSQLTQRTNQFNLTTKRYAEAEIQSFISSDAYEVYDLQLTDKFGDNGIVGLAIVEKEGSAWRIDTFLLSCRVMGRTVETAFLGYIVEQVRQAGVQHIIGEYIQTKKNVPVKDFYQQQGFERISKTGGLWRLDLNNKGISLPPWITIN